MNTVTRCTEIVGAVCPIFGCQQRNSEITIDFKPEATAEQRAAAAAALAAIDLSPAAQEAWALTRSRQDAVEAVGAVRSRELLAVRAVAAFSRGELNEIRQWIAAFKSVVANAGSLAQLKDGVAALPAMPNITAVELRQRIADKINSGVAD
jgi:hypothetical protein